MLGPSVSKTAGDNVTVELWPPSDRLPFVSWLSISQLYSSMAVFRILVDRDNSGFTICFLTAKLYSGGPVTNSLMTVGRVQVHRCQRVLVADASVWDESWLNAVIELIYLRERRVKVRLSSPVRGLMWITETQCEWNWARVAELFRWRTTVATVVNVEVVGVLSPRECDGRAVVLPSTGVVESIWVECYGGVVGRTSVTCPRRERPSLVAGFPCRTGRCCFVVGRRRPCSRSRRHLFDAVGRATTAIPFPRPCLTDGRRCRYQVVVESEQVPISRFTYIYIFPFYSFFLSFGQFCCLVRQVSLSFMWTFYLFTELSYMKNFPRFVVC